MKKDELKTGMKVKLDDSTIGIILFNTKDGDICELDDGRLLHLRTLPYDLKNSNIVCVYEPDKDTYIYSQDEVGSLLWYSKVYSKKQKHTIQIDGKTIELSEESYKALKDAIGDE